MRAESSALGSQTMKRNKGFTLIEVIISLLILAVTASTMASAFWVGGKALGRNQKKRTALALAQEVIEYARSAPFGEDIVLQPLPEEFSKFNRKIRTEYVTNYDFNIKSSTPTDYIRINVTVSASNIPDIALVTVKYKYLLYEPNIPDITQ